MLDRYFQEELAHLKDLAVSFSKAHPTVAPMLSGPSADPDAERLLEGVAFLTSLLRRKLDDEFPELIHDLIRLILPHYLRPIPSAAIIAFNPKPALKQSVTVPAGTQLASVPVEGTSCLFQTCFDVELHPLHLLETSIEEASGRSPAIKLILELRGLKFSDWRPKSLRFFLGGEYVGAANLHLLLRNHLREIVIRPLGGDRTIRLAPDQLEPCGFSAGEGLIPYPSHAFPGYRILQEFFILPEKFLFLNLPGWEGWEGDGDESRFEIVFQLEEIPFAPPRIRNDTFLPFATPVINVFPYEADPIRLDHRKTEYHIRPSTTNLYHFQVYSIESVVGYIQGTAEERRYVPFEIFDPEPHSKPVYQVTTRPSPAEAGLETYLSVSYPPAAGPPVSETLSLGLLCTNGTLPESLQAGDVSVPTSSSPEFAEFKNIHPPTLNVLTPLGSNLLWRLLSHLSLNYASLERAENLKALLDLYVFPKSRDQTALLTNKRRISGIDSLETKATSRLIQGFLMKGREIIMKVRQDHFAGPGDLFLFGCILDHFMGSYASINTYTSLVIEEVLKGDRYQWPARIGNQRLI
jgi:type VI secretion system protein ImpG